MALDLIDFGPKTENAGELVEEIRAGFLTQTQNPRYGGRYGKENHNRGVKKKDVDKDAQSLESGYIRQPAGEGIGGSVGDGEDDVEIPITVIQPNEEG